MGQGPHIGEEAGCRGPAGKGAMFRLVVRVWLPDRPGALGAVASRIGAVRGDVVGIEILERGAGRAIDELVVEVPDSGLVDLLVAEIGQVDGVDVEDVRPLLADTHEPGLAVLEAAARLAGATAADDLTDELVAEVATAFEAGWCAVVGADGAAGAAVGPVPPRAWTAAFVAGSRAAGDGRGSGPDDVAWAPLTPTDLTLVVGRDGRPFRARERAELAALARIAGARTAELGQPDGSQPLARSTARRQPAWRESATAAGTDGANSTSSRHWAATSSSDDHTPSASPAR